jgi:hypothetical protein
MKGNPMSLNPLGAKHNAKRQLHFFQNRPLLDVQFQISSYVPAFSAGITNPIDIDAAVPKSILQMNSIAVCPNAVSGNRMSAGKRRRSEEAPAEASALLISPIDQSNRDRWSAVRILRETAQHLKPRKNAQAAIQPTAVRYRIEMASQNKRLF